MVENEIDWALVSAGLDADGHATLGRLLSDGQCNALIDTYTDDALYRSRIVMSRHGFGQGEYKYFANPLPPMIQSLRELLYPALAEIANRWESQLGSDVRYPATLSAFQDQCHAVGQTRPTPLILKYEHGGYNCLHQDLYGAVHFPLQIVILLSEPGVSGASGNAGDGDFEGGEFVLTEQRPRMQSRAQVLQLQRGVGVVFPVNNRPRQGVRGFYRVKQRHGVSTVLRGSRFSLGIIFHDAA